MTLTARLAECFRSHSRQWLDGKELVQIAGGYGWRTRVSELRRRPFFMTIENRQRRHGRTVVSEYRFIPDTKKENTEEVRRAEVELRPSLLQF